MATAPTMENVFGLFDEWLSHKDLKRALQSMADAPLNELGTPSAATTFTARLDGSERKFRLSLEMADEAGEFSDDNER